MEMKKCKECGKLFTPKSARTQYCDDLHYRPCPVCGKLVEAKYLSDPARCCSKECQQVMRANSSKSKIHSVPAEPAPVPKKSIEDIIPKASSATSSRPTFQKVEDLYGTCVFGTGDENSELEALYDYEDEIRENYICATYIKNPVLRFEPGHEYALEISRKKDRPYEVNAIYDFTRSKQVSLQMLLSSKISINQNFTKGVVKRNEDGTITVVKHEPVYDLNQV